VAEAKASGEKASLARAYSALDLSYRWLGEADKAVYADEALAIYEELGDLSGMAVVTGNLGVAAYFDGRWQDSLGLHERTREAFLRAGNEVQAAYAAANIGEMLVLLGPGHKAIEPLQEALRVLRASGFVDGAAFAEVQLGRALAEQGEVAAAQGLLEHAYATFSALGELASAVDASVHLATCLISAGHPDEALGVLDRARTLAGAGVTIAKSAVLRTRAAALMELGQADQAGECAAAALAEAERSGLTYDIALAHLLKAEIDQRAGVSTDENATARAAQMLRDLGVRTPRSLLSGVGVV
jgi:tetratricopeptide (TPR) repeat protein